jgi:hypothetical protein
MTEANTGLYRRQFLIFLVASGLVILLAILLTANNARLAAAARDETLAYNHGRHVEAGIDCVYCHPGVLSGPVAGIPSTAKCMGCHQNVQVREEAQEDIAILFDHWESGEPLRWRKTFDQPDFVYYTHQPHIAAGYNCETCHGNVAEMAYLEQTIRLNMGFCLACHRQPDSGNAPRVVQATAGGAWRLIHQQSEPDKVVRLETCSTCHQ